MFTEFYNLIFFLFDAEENCWDSKYGCCPDRKTLADGPGKAGCGGKSLQHIDHKKFVVNKLFNLTKKESSSVVKRCSDK